MLKIKKEIIALCEESEKELYDQFKEIDIQCLKNSQEVINAFHKFQVSEAHFIETTGYGYGDLGRETIENIFADVLKGEDALVRNQFISGSHALTVALFACLRPNDLMLSISGLPYDTLHEVIGIKDNNSSLKSYNIKYGQIDLVNDEIQLVSYLKK